MKDIIIVPSGFPGELEKNIKCPKCSKVIGTREIGKELGKKLEIVKRDKYYRIFKDNEEKEALPKEKKMKLNEINYLTLDEFKENYIKKLFDNEKGLHQIDKNYFKKEDKIIRNLSPITYRLLNYILYSHLFFARLITNLNRFDKYLPKKMKWGETLNECWILLEKELKKKEINSIDVFMNFIFKDLFNALHEKDIINNYDELISFEDEIESIIQEKIKNSQEEYKKYKELINKESVNKESSINFLKEEFEPKNYPKEKYPYYEYLYYTYYIDEKYISQYLSHGNENKYLVLNIYLKNKNDSKNKNEEDKSKNKNEDKTKTKNKDDKTKTKNKDDKLKNKEKKDYYSLDDLNLFNSVLNLFNERYSHKISREFAKKQSLKVDDIYQNQSNSELIDKFIKFYNKLKIKNNKEEVIKLTNENNLSDFLLDSDNEIGKTYIVIYKQFIK